MSNANKLLKNFSSSAVGNILGQAIGVFILMYLPRVLGPEGYGVFNFAQSYIMYFLLLSDLGLSLYCIRKVNQSDNTEIIINKIYNIKFYISVISTIIFFISVYFINKPQIEKNTLYCIGMTVFFIGISIEYMFTALSNMKYVGMSVVIKNIVFSILCLLFIKQSNHVYLVAIFYSISALFVVIFLHFKFKKVYYKLKLNKPKLEDFIILKRSFPLALSLFMVQINNNFDIIYLSFAKTQSEVGYYSAPYRIVNFLVAILCIYLNAGYPSIAELQLEGKEALSRFINKFYKMGIFIVMPIVFGGIALNSQIINLFFGAEYYESQLLFVILIPLLLIRMITATYGAVLIMGKGSKFFSKGVMIGAFINILLNIVLVPKYGAVGAAIATIICESVQGVYLHHYYLKYCSSNLFILSIKSLIASSLMFVVLRYINLNVFISISIGVLVYFISAFVIDLLLKEVQK